MRITIKEFRTDSGKFIDISKEESVEIYDENEKLVMTLSSLPPYVDDVIEMLDLMKDRERRQFFEKLRGNFCFFCGKRTKRTCHCENDE